jgi:cytochrome c oxidase cbb3-type subunit III
MAIPKHSRSATGLVLLLVLAICASAQSTDPEKRVEHGRQFLGLGPRADPIAAARGQKIFSQTCGFCHGVNATGGEGPDLVRSSLVLHDENGELIGQVVSKGRPERGMPAFPALSADQITDIAQFLHARVEAAANRFGYKLLNIVTGDAAAGKAFFSTHCTECHSAEGDLAHIAAKFGPTDLQTQFLYPVLKADDDAAATTVTVKLASGETISGRLKALDDFSVLLWDSQGNYRSFDRSVVSVDLHDPLAGHRKLLAEYTNTSMHNVLAYLVTLK